MLAKTCCSIILTILISNLGCSKENKEAKDQRIGSCVNSIFRVYDIQVLGYKYGIKMIDWCYDNNENF